MFGRYDVRGVWGKDLTVDTVRRLGEAIRKVIGEGELAIGKDARYVSHIVFYHLLEGLSGDIIDLGLTTTPMTLFYAWKEGKETLQITASHNPPEFIGLKFTHAGGESWGTEDLRKLQEAFESSKSAVNPHSLAFDRSFVFSFYEYFDEFPKINVPFVVDFSNGVGYLYRPVLEKKLDARFLNAEPDGRFPSHPPDPVLPEAHRDILSHPAPFGAVLDGDADRVFFKRDGKIVQPEEVVADITLFYGYGSVVVDTMSSVSLEIFLQDNGVRVFRSSTGRIFLRKTAREKRTDFFGEYSGHFGFKGFNYIDDSLYAILTYARVVERNFRSGYTPWPSSGVRTVRTSAPLDELLVHAFDPDEVVTADGLDMRKEGARVVVRRSGSEPGKWRLLWEADSKESYEELTGRLTNLLKDQL